MGPAIMAGVAITGLTAGGTNCPAASNIDLREARPLAAGLLLCASSPMHDPHRDAHSHPGCAYFLPPRHEVTEPTKWGREWRAEKRNPMASVSVAGHGGRLSARHMRRLCDRTGPAFAWVLPAIALK